MTVLMCSSITPLFAAVQQVEPIRSAFSIRFENDFFGGTAGGAANLIARNLTLDGNSFAESRSVDKRLFLPAAEFGASLWTRKFQTTFSYVMWGKEFYGQPDREDYGSVLLTYFF
jgi:hypothetical protein